MVDNKEVMNWALELGKQAFTEAKSGDASLLNRLGGNKSFKMFMDNVVGTGYVKADQFPSYYASAWVEIRRLYEEVQKQEQIEQSVDKVAALETKFDALAELVKNFIESQQKPVETTEATEAPAKKTGKKPPKTEVVDAEAVETKTESTEADAESEA